MKKIVNLAIAAAAAFAALPVAAQTVQISEDGSYRATVHYGDLNLASAAGRRTLEGRIEAAADKICGFAQAPTLSAFQEVQDCRNSIKSAARPQMELAAGGRGNGSIAIAASR